MVVVTAKLGVIFRRLEIRKSNINLQNQAKDTMIPSSRQRFRNAGTAITGK
jgi:hypothetical protein